MSRRTGVLGGMFDPVHLGHIEAARAGRERCSLDRVFLLPCGNPVHRSDAITPALQRCEMLSLAVSDEPWLNIDDRECRSALPSRTFDTLTSLAAELPDDNLYFILGMDAFLTLPAWYHWLDIFKLAHLVVVTRSGHELQDSGLSDALRREWLARLVPAEQKDVPEKSGRIHLATLSTSALSSSQVRHLLQQGLSATACLPRGVAAYIETNHLYRHGVVI
jgi:nicotinate-nucleotide adenylyltransferase